MQLTFINHSAFIVEYDGVRIFIDPWIDGTVFNNGWDLITPTPFAYEDFRHITHIWFSHEHPDHFNPPNINKIPAEYRKHITVLFQETIDKRVVNHCRKVGFGQVIEMKPGQWLPLTANFQAMCEHYAEGDSWLALKTPEHTYLNTNDCGIRDKRRGEEIAAKVGAVDLLLSQFSYAFWAGNPEQTALRAQMAKDKLFGLKFQCDIFKPKRVVPIASMVWFCHQENFYLNDLINTPRSTMQYLQQHTACEVLVLYPGDQVAPNGPHDNEVALRKYEADYTRVQQSAPKLQSPAVDMDALVQQSQQYVANLRHNPWARWLLRPTTIYVWDAKQAYRLDLQQGLTTIALDEATCDVALSADSLQYCFKFPWGTDTLGINGRYRRPVGGSYQRFHNFFRFEQLKSHGTEVGLQYLLGVAFRKVYEKLGLSGYRVAD